MPESNGSEILEEDYAEFLEKAIRKMHEHKPRAICFSSIGEDGSCFCGYWNCDYTDKGRMAHVILTDSFFDSMELNKGYIINMLGETNEDNGQTEE